NKPIEGSYPEKIRKANENVIKNSKVNVNFINWTVPTQMVSAPKGPLKKDAHVSITLSKKKDGKDVFRVSFHGDMVTPEALGERVAYAVSEKEGRMYFVTNDKGFSLGKSKTSPRRYFKKVSDDAEFKVVKGFAGYYYDIYFDEADGKKVYWVEKKEARA
ncbi:MAG: hypothetical protein Q4C42_11715, partial [Clostridia bacterium]|nr:hypothetical protein [Clostridia bacterium]